jgi:basic membrane protein A
LVFDVGGRGDQSFNDSAWRGLESARDQLGACVQTIDPGEGGDRESGVRELAAQGDDLVIGVGFMFSDDMYAVAQEYPNVRFACVDYAKFGADGTFVTPPPNMVALKFREQEGSFLVGALAALVSHTHGLGFVGGMDIPLIHKFAAGYQAGVRAVCPDCPLTIRYAGNDPSAFKDPVRGKELAAFEFGGGADVIFHASGSTGLGVFEEAQELGPGHLVIGVDSDQYKEAPGQVLTSMVKGVDVAVYDTIHDLTQGRFTPGVRSFGLAEGGVGYVYDDHNRGLIPDDVRARVEALKADIIAGRIQVPDGTEPGSP